MNRKILFQVAAPALVIGLLLVGTCVVGAWSIQRLHDNLSRILSRNVASLQAALELENSLRQLRYHSLLYLTGPTDASLQQIEQDEHHFEAALQQAREAAHTDTAHDLLTQIERGYRQYHQEMAQLRDEVARHGPKTDFQQLALSHPIRHVVTPCQELRAFDKAQVQNTVAESEQVSRQGRWALLLLGIAGPLGGGLLGYGIVRGLNLSIARLRLRVHDVVHRLRAPLPVAPVGTSAEPAKSSDDLIDVGSLTVASDGDLADLDRQLAHVLRRVEEVMERLRRQHWDMLRAEQLAAVGQLAAGVAHEVRNPLTAMKLLVEAALRPGPRGGLTEEDLRVICGEIVRLEETVEHFLSFARLPHPKREICDLRYTIGSSLELVRTRAQRQGVEIETVVPPEPIPVDLDAGQFHQVVLNLLLNALDVMPRGGRVTLRLETSRELARLSVLDTGPGIAPEMVGRLFTPFASTKPTGTGLGLSLARRIVEEHGGSITGGNVPAGGASFTILLPCVQREQGIQVESSLSLESPSGAAGRDQVQARSRWT
jgi:signal transduction histidine kinase